MANQEILEELREALSHLNKAVEIADEEGIDEFGLRLKYLRDKCKSLISRLSDEE